MSLPEFSMKELLEAGVHFGHQTHRWNPKMKDFIYGEHNNIHIIDRPQTMGMWKNALGVVREVTQSGGRILFVGTKRQASETISESASQCAQYYVNHRWLGGTLTNWKTISNTIARLKSIQETLDEEESAGLTKKELLKLTRERDKLELSIGGIKNMGSLPDLIFVIDTVREQIAIKEANKLYCDLVSQAALDGISIQSQKVQEETQDKKEKPQKETASKKDNKSKELSDVSKIDDGKEIKNLEENNDKSKSEEKD